MSGGKDMSFATRTMRFTLQASLYNNSPGNLARRVLSIPLQRVKENLLRIRNALNHAGLERRSSIYYAMKANRFAPLMRFIKQTGLCGIDACSPNEVKHAISCGFSPSEISFTATSLSEKAFAALAR